MKILVTGGRNFSDTRIIHKKLDQLHARKPVTELVHGNATGLDTTAARWAVARGIKVTACAADWDSPAHHRAGNVRNASMLREHNPELVIAFQGGRGTLDMTLKARATGVPVFFAWADSWLDNLDTLK